MISNPGLSMTSKFSGARKKRRLWLLAIPCALVLATVSRSENAARVERDVQYGEAGGQKLRLDVFQPAGETAVHPAVVLVHGGGWREGDKRDFDELARVLSDSGYACFSVNYRLVKHGANQYPAQIDDVQRAVRWIRSRAATYHIDPNRLAGLGASAGGHLVALLGTRDTRDNRDASLAGYSSRVSCVVDLFGPTDFTIQPSEKATQNPDVRNLVLDFFGKTPKEAPELYRDASPIAHIDRKTVPFLIFHGRLDAIVPLDQSQRMHNALLKNGTFSRLVIFPDEGHGIQKPENRTAFGQQTVAFLKRFMPDPTAVSTRKTTP